MSKHILVIDDQESMRTIISQVLKDNGFKVTMGQDGEEGLSLFNGNPGAFDMIMADVNMPKVDGFEFLKQVKEKMPDMPVVFLTGINHDVAETVGQIYKVDAIIRKPFQVNDVLSIVNKITAN